MSALKRLMRGSTEYDYSKTRHLIRFGMCASWKYLELCALDILFRAKIQNIEIRATGAEVELEIADGSYVALRDLELRQPAHLRSRERSN